MAITSKVLRADLSRVWLLAGRANPQNTPQYSNLWAAGTSTWDQGKITPVYQPAENQYGAFVLVDKVPGEPGLPEITLENDFLTDISQFLQLVEGGCDNDLQIHFGKCKDPRQFNQGWDKVLVLEAARAASHTTSALGALEPNKRAVITETVKFEGVTLYEIKPMLFSQKASSYTNDEVVAIHFCDAPTCGTCGIASDGCQVIFAAMLNSAGSPGLFSTVLFSINGGATWGSSVVNSLASNRNPSDLVCVGPNVVVASSDGTALEYAAVSDIVNSVSTPWTQMATGFVASKGPKRIFSPSSAFTYIVGLGGYIYFSNDPTSSVTVLDAGSATTQDFNSINGLDINTWLAVGNNNAVVYTLNAGTTITSVVGPAVGVNLTACWMKSPTEWFVSTAGGRLFYTLNSGTTWFEKSFPGSGSGVVRDLQFVTDTIGYMAHDTTTPKGRILRSIDGGNSWYVMPEQAGQSIPANNRITRLAVCANRNIIMGGGLASNGVAGIIVGGA